MLVYKIGYVIGCEYNEGVVISYTLLARLFSKYFLFLNVNIINGSIELCIC